MSELNKVSLEDECESENFDLDKKNKSHEFFVNIIRYRLLDQKKVLISFLDKINCTPGKQDIQLIIERSGLTNRQIINWYFYHRTKQNTE